MICSKCGADRVIPRAILIDNNAHILCAKVERHPEAMIFKGESTSTLVARICGECGFTEIYADAPDELYQAYRDFLQASKEATS